MSTPHPAKYSDGIVELMRTMLHKWLGAGRVLDPFAGTGLIHLLHPDYSTWGLEIEPEWANMHARTLQGDALDMPHTWTSFFHAVCTSVTYGNRMADHQEPNERCALCKGNGWIVEGQTWENPYGEQLQCPRCGGKGNNEYQRLTYRHQLGHQLHPNNSGGMQWGKKYQDFHVKAWLEVHRVLMPGGYLLLNVSDHVRKGEVQPVSKWHVDTLRGLGFTLLEAHKIPTKRMRFGANYKLRVEHEWLFVFTKRHLPELELSDYESQEAEEPDDAREDRGLEDRQDGDSGAGSSEEDGIAPPPSAESTAGSDDREQPVHAGTGTVDAHGLGSSEAAQHRPERQ